MEEEKRYNIIKNISISSLDKYIDKKINKSNINTILSILGINYGIFYYNQRIKDKDLTTKQKFKNLISNIEISLKEMEKNSLNDLINFNSKKIQRIYSSNIGRYRKYKINDFFQLKVNSIIKIQKKIRSFLTRKYIINIFTQHLKKRIYNYIIKIQNSYRKYNKRMRLKRALIIKSILEQRKKKYLIIQKYINKYYFKIINKKIIIIKRVLENRLNKIIYLQRKIKAFYIKKLTKQIIEYEKYHYVLTYPFKAQSVKLIIYNNASSPFIINKEKEQYKEFSFEICPIRKIFVLYIFKNHIKYGKYRCQFIVDGKKTCDGRFTHIENLKGEFYNCIYFDPYETHLENYNHNNRSYLKENNITLSFDNYFDNYYIINNNKNNKYNTKSFATTNSNSNSSLQLFDELFKKDLNNIDEIIDFISDI